MSNKYSLNTNSGTCLALMVCGSSMPGSGWDTLLWSCHRSILFHSECNSSNYQSCPGDHLFVLYNANPRLPESWLGPAEPKDNSHTSFHVLGHVFGVTFYRRARRKSRRPAEHTRTDFHTLIMVEFRAGVWCPHNIVDYAGWNDHHLQKTVPAPGTHSR